MSFTGSYTEGEPVCFTGSYTEGEPVCFTGSYTEGEPVYFRSFGLFHLEVEKGMETII